jgi:hypothetical protein
MQISSLTEPAKVAERIRFFSGERKPAREKTHHPREWKAMVFHEVGNIRPGFVRFSKIRPRIGVSSEYSVASSGAGERKEWGG